MVFEDRSTIPSRYRRFFFDPGWTPPPSLSSLRLLPAPPPRSPIFLLPLSLPPPPRPSFSLPFPSPLSDRSLSLFPPPLRASGWGRLRGPGILKRSRRVRYGLGEVLSDLEETQKCLRGGSGMICGGIGMN